LVGYIWAAPNTLIGLVTGAIPILFGASVRRVAGIIEIAGGRLGKFLVSPSIACPYRAITLGHVILATSRSELDAARSHEHIHVRQYERWGPFFLPAYLTSSLWQLVCGRRCYRDNYFEREAFRAGSPEA
jgi:hypothetical protein